MPIYHQARPRLKVVSYGHFGRPAYSSLTKSWSFARNSKKYFEVLPIGDPQDLLPATVDAQEEGPLRQDVHGKEELYAKALQYEIDDVIRAYPELVAAEKWVNPLVRLSEGITSAASVYDPAVGGLMSRGFTSIICAGAQEILPLLAAPAGAGGEALRLIRLKSQDYTLEEQDGSIESYLATKEVGYWAGKGAPVLQVLFSTAATGTIKNGLLAVRLPGCTIIMYPRYRPKAIIPSGNRFEESLPPSRIDPNILCEVLPRDTGGLLHADIAFNPWGNREFAIINQHGDWSTFHVKRIHEKRPIYVAVRMNSGFAPRNEDEGSGCEDRAEDQEAQQHAQNGGSMNSKEADQLSHQASPARPYDTSGDEGNVSPKAMLRSGSSKRSPSVRQQMQAESDAGSASSGTGQNLSGGRRAGGQAYGVSEEAVESSQPEEDTHSSARAKQDGWARIMYALNSVTLVACTRREAYIFDTDTGESFEFPNLFPDHKTVSWHLDLKPCSRHFDHVFVLTGYSIHLVRIFEADLREATKESNPRKAEVVLSALHFRDPKDISLRLDVAADGDLYLVSVSSSYNDNVSCVRFTLPSNQDSQPSATEVIPFSVNADTRGRGMRAICTSLRSLKSPDSLFTDDMDAAAAWFSLETLQKNLAIRQAFYFVRASFGKPNPSIPYAMALLDERVPEDMLSCLIIPPNHDVANGGSPETDRFSKDVVIRPSQQFVNHWNAIAAIIGQDQTVNEKFPIRDLASFHEDVQIATHETPAAGLQPMLTLFELVGKVLPIFGDARETSFAIEDVLPLEVVHFQLNGLAVAQDHGATAGMIFDLIHGRLEELFVSPLNDALSAVFSQRRAQIARATAAEVSSASCTLRMEDISQKHEAEMKEEERRPQSQVPSQLSQSQSQSRSQSQADTALSIRTQSPHFASPDDLMEPILQRLGRRVKLNLKPAQEWQVEPMTALDHWEVGTKTKDYSYAIVSARLDAEREFAGLSEAEKKTTLKRQQKVQKKRDKELRKEIRLGLGSSQAPIVSSQVPMVGSQVGASGTVQRLIRGSQRDGRMTADFGGQASKSQMTGKGKGRAKSTQNTQNNAAIATPSSSQTQNGVLQMHEAMEIPPASSFKRSYDDEDREGVPDASRDLVMPAQQQPTPAATLRSQQHNGQLASSQFSRGSQLTGSHLSGSQRSKRRRAGF